MSDGNNKKKFTPYESSEPANSETSRNNPNGGNSRNRNGANGGNTSGNGTGNGSTSKTSTDDTTKKDSKGETVKKEDDEKKKPVGRGRGRGSSSESSSAKSDEKKEGDGCDKKDDNKSLSGESEAPSLVPSEQRKDGRALLLSNRYKDAFVTRPEHIVNKSATIAPGSSKQLLVNYFRLNLSREFQFLQYRVDFEPDEARIRARRQLISSCSSRIRGYVYDGENMIFLTRPLPSDTFQMPVRLEIESKNFVVTFRKTDQVIRMTDGLATHVLNCLLRKSMLGLDLKEIQRNLFDEEAKITLHDWRLELWPGYITSIRKYEQDILVCCEITHKVMRQDTVYDILAESVRRRGEFRTEFTKEIVGTIVLTRYNNKTYRVDDVKFDVTPRTTFDFRGTETSFIQYYQQRYNITIRNHDQPLLLSAPKARDIRAGGGVATPILLIPELCVTTGLTDHMRNNFQLMRSMSDYTRMSPKDRVGRLLEFSRRINQTNRSSQALESFGVELDRNLVTVEGRSLPQERIIFGNNAVHQNDDRVDWTPAIRNNSMYHSEQLRRWGIVYPKRCERELQDFMPILNEVARGLRVEVAEPKMIMLYDDRLPTYCEKLAEFCGKDPSFVMIVLPTNSADRYAAVKKVTYVRFSVPSQVIVSKTMQPKKGNWAGVKSIATKVILQMITKLGGAPWMISMPLSGVMVIGYDATHDTSNRQNSYGAFVASMDLKHRVKYYSAVSRHRNGEELAANISVQFQKALIAFRNEHATFPERVLFYRDGVGDGDIQYVAEYEKKKMQHVMKSNYDPQNLPKFAFIIVNKRINTRIIAKDGNRMENPPSGTVVDRAITSPERYDFFLISQSVRQGTVSPTYYNIIHDQFGLPPDKMQMLTYKMCHLYYNWCGTTRVPAVVQYAHKLSILVGQYIHEPTAPALDGKLYYL